MLPTCATCGSRTSLVSLPLGGATVEVSTVETVPETGIRAFAAAVPAGATITDVVGQRRDGSAAVRATDIADQMARLSGPNAVDGIMLPVAFVP